MTIARPGTTPAVPLRELEERHIAHVLEVVGGNRRQAARALGIMRRSLARRVEKYGLRVRQPEGDTWPGTHDG